LDNQNRNYPVLEQPTLPQQTLEQIAQLWHAELRFNVRTSIGEEGEGERRLAQK
jgi:hypothetical protein